MRSVPSLPSGTFSQAPCPSIWCTQSSSRSRSSPRRSPVARVSSSASACSRASGLGPDADSSSSATASRRSASGGQVAGQRVRGVRDVPGEQQRPGRGGGPAPLGDVGEELADGEDLPAPVPERVRPPVRMPGGGERGQPGFDVRAPVQRGQVGDRRVAGGQEPAEPGQVAGDRLDRGRGAGGGGLRAVVEQQPAQRFGDPAVVPAQPGAAPRIGRWLGQDAEVEQHPVRRGDQAAVVRPAAGVALRLGAGAERRRQLREVGRGQRGQRPPGLDQQPHHDPFGGALDDVARCSPGRWPPR